MSYVLDLKNQRFVILPISEMYFDNSKHQATILADSDKI